MIKLSKEKRNQLIMVILCTLMIIAALWFLVLSLQRASLERISARIDAVQQKLDKMQRAVKESATLEAELTVAAARLSAIETNMVTGDPYSWFIDTVKHFTLGHRVELPQISPAVTGEVNMFPKFPYRQAMVGVAGSAYYEDLGRFLADFENDFPYMRLQNLELEPATALAPGDKEKLSFRMEILMLVKPAS
jgi:Tfp pilus assembly protein PilO